MEAMANVGPRIIRMRVGCLLGFNRRCCFGSMTRCLKGSRRCGVIAFFPSSRGGYLRGDLPRFIAPFSGFAEQLPNTASEPTVVDPNAVLDQPLVNHFERVALIYGGFNLRPSVPDHVHKPRRVLLAECDDSGKEVSLHSLPLYS